MFLLNTIYQKEEVTIDELNQQIDWDKIVSVCSKNYLKIVSDYYKKGLSTTKIGKKMDFDRHTIQRMLMDASKMDWV